MEHQQPPDANDVSSTPGQVSTFSLTDFTEMDVLGFNLNLPSADNVAVPAQTTYQKMYGVAPSSTELFILKQFDAAQSIYGQSIGVQDPALYMYQALGVALADPHTGSVAFQTKWGPQLISSDASFVTQAYVDVFGAQGVPAAIQSLINDVNFFKTLYATSGAYGTNTNEIDLLARGAVYGLMLGVKAELPAAAQEASSLTDTALVGVGSQHDVTHVFI